MRVLLGIWHGQYALFFKDRPDHPGFMTLERERSDNSGALFLHFQHEGGREASRHKADAEETMDYPWVIRTDRPADDGFCRCGLMPLTLKKWGSGALDWWCELPHDHLFPWPNARDCESYVKSEELTADLTRRRKHAALVGARFPTPPGNITAAMTPRQRKELFR